MKKVLILMAMILFGLCLVGCNHNDTTEIVNGVYVSEKDNLFCIINNETITISKKIASSEICDEYFISDVLKFKLRDGTYYGENIRKSISFYLENEKLYLKINGKSYSLLLDTKSQIVDTPVKLEKPSNVKFDSSQIFWYITEYENPYEHGIMNVTVKVISVENNDLVKYDLTDYISLPASMFLYNLKNMNLSPGEYYIEIMYTGGSYLVDGKIFSSIDSEPLTLSLSVSNSNDYQVKNIEEEINK